MAKRDKEKYLVLMVDDSEDDCILIRLAMESAQRLQFIGSVSDGVEALNYLKGTGDYSDRQRFPIPDLMLLDLKMPRKNGFEVLEWLKQQPFKDMIVVVFSGANAPQDEEKALALGADHYQPKELSYGKRARLIELLEEYLTEKFLK